MTTTVKRGSMVPQTEYCDDESILGPIAKTMDKGPVTRTANKVERTLLCLDGPWIGEAALSYIEDYISRLAPKLKVEIYLLQVITEMTHYRVGDGTVTIVPYTEEETKQAANETRGYLNQAGEPLRKKGLTVVAKVSIGADASKEIVKTAEEIGANLIVMFTNKRSWLSRLASGSVTDKVLRREENIPIMVVRTEHLMSEFY
ncbi:universal stress protein [Chloroflexota bacterium]